MLKERWIYTCTCSSLVCFFCMYVSLISALPQDLWCHCFNKDHALSLWPCYIQKEESHPLRAFCLHPSELPAFQAFVVGFFLSEVFIYSCFSIEVIACVVFSFLACTLSIFNSFLPLQPSIYFHLVHIV